MIWHISVFCLYMAGQRYFSRPLACCRLTRLTHLELDGQYAYCWNAVDSIAIPDSLVDLRLQQPILSPSALSSVLTGSSPIRHLTLKRWDGEPGDDECYDVDLAPSLRYGLSLWLRNAFAPLT